MLIFLFFYLLCFKPTKEETTQSETFWLCQNVPHHTWMRYKIDVSNLIMDQSRLILDQHIRTNGIAYIR